MLQVDDTHSGGRCASQRWSGGVPDRLAPGFLADGKTCVRDCRLEEGLVGEASGDVGSAISVSARVGDQTPTSRAALRHGSQR